MTKVADDANASTEPQSRRVARLEIPIANLSCAGSAAPLARRIRRLQGVQDAVVNPVTERAVITYDPRLTSEHSLVEALGREIGVAVDRWIAVATQRGLLRGRIVLRESDRNDNGGGGR